VCKARQGGRGWRWLFTGSGKSPGLPADGGPVGDCTVGRENDGFGTEASIDQSAQGGRLRVGLVAREAEVVDKRGDRP